MGRMGHQGREGGKSPKRMQDLDNKELIWLSNQQVTRRLCGTLQHQCFKSQLPEHQPQPHENCRSEQEVWKTGEEESAV